MEWQGEGKVVLVSCKGIFDNFLGPGIVLIDFLCEQRTVNAVTWIMQKLSIATQGHVPVHLSPCDYHSCRPLTETLGRWI